MSAKPCMRCGVTKDIAEFYAHPQMSDGHLNKCKECTKADIRANRRKRVDYYREYDRRRFSTEARKVTRLACHKRAGAKHPDRFRARAAVARAIRAGRLTRKLCEVCGESQTHAHHDDYSKPLDVRWLCVKHHLITHGKYIEQTA